MKKGMICFLFFALAQFGFATSKKGFYKYIADLKSRDFMVKNNALFSLGALGDKRAVTYLIKMLKSRDSKLLFAFVVNLGELRDKRATLPLVKLFTPINRSLFADIVQALGKIKDPRATPALIRVLSIKDSWLQRLTAMALGNIGDSRAVPALIHALKNSERSVVGRAAEALGKIKDQRAFLPLMSTKIRKNGYSFDVEPHIARALGRLGDRRAVPKLIKMLDSGFYLLRQAAIVALGQLRDKRVIKPLILFLYGEESGVAALALAKIGGHIAFPDLKKALAYKKITPENKRAIIWALSIASRKQAEVFLRNISKKEDAATRFLARAILRYILKKDSLRLLTTAMLKHKNGRIRSNAAWLLGMLRDNQAVPALIDASFDGLNKVRAEAVLALGKIADRRAIPVLKQHLKYANMIFRAYVTDALCRIRGEAIDSY